MEVFDALILAMDVARRFACLVTGDLAIVQIYSLVAKGNKAIYYSRFATRDAQDY
jgi:hypothetical protein